jgi:amino acid permease
MKNKASIILLGLSLFSIAGCSGMKVIHPDDPGTKNAGTKQLDFSSGTPKIVSTFTCSIVASDGTRVSALGKSEAEARKEALAKCRSQTLVSICREENLKCSPN